MKEKVDLIDPLMERVESYSKTSIELIKLKTVDKVSDGAASAVAWIVVGFAAILFFITLNFGLALWIGTLLGQIYSGFFIVAAFYALAGIILFVYKDKWIKKPLIESIINQMLN